MQYVLPNPGTIALERVRDRLRARRGPQHDAQRYDPVSQLIYGILSARTYDQVATTAFVRLARSFHPWRHLCWAQHAEIEALIGHRRSDVVMRVDDDACAMQFFRARAQCRIVGFSRTFLC